MTWGDSNWGGDSSAVSDDLENITRLYSNEAAFAAVKSDGLVVTWGNDSFGVDSPSVSAELMNINEIYSTQTAFAAVKDQEQAERDYGSIECWETGKVTNMDRWAF